MLSKLTFNNVALLVGIVGMLGITAYISFSQGAQSSSSAETEIQGVLTVSEEDWDLGDISMADGDSVKEITLTNNSEGSVDIKSLSTSCMCTTGQIIHADGSKSRVKGMPGHGEPSSMRETIEAGETATLQIIFDPLAHGPSATGPISRSVFLETTGDKQSEIELRFSGDVIK